MDSDKRWCRRKDGISGYRIRATSNALHRIDDWRKRKRKRRHYGYEYRVVIFHFITSSFVLAFGELSSLKTHFRPFTEVMRKSRREVTREFGARA
jgi:hypothetical protein